MCLQHALGGMVNVVERRQCSHPNCPTWPSYGMAGSSKAEMCLQHASYGMVYLIRRGSFPGGAGIREAGGGSSGGGRSRHSPTARMEPDAGSRLQGKRRGRTGTSTLAGVVPIEAAARRDEAQSVIGTVKAEVTTASDDVMRPPARSQVLVCTPHVRHKRTRPLQVRCCLSVFLPWLMGRWDVRSTQESA